MPYKIIWEERGIYINQYGIVDLDDIVKMQHEGYGSTQIDNINYIIWDGTKIDDISLTRDQQVIIAAQDIGASHWKKNIYHATVSSKEKINFFCKRHIEILEEIVKGWKFKHFKSLDEARHWIKSSTMWNRLK